MTDPDPKGITPDPDPKGGAPTQEPKPAAKIELTQEEYDKKMQERQARGEAAATKKLQAQIDVLQAKVNEFEGKDLDELEKLQKKLDKATKDLADKDTELTGTNLKLAKLTTLLKAGAQPDKLEGLIKRVAGTTEEEIQADVQELVALGWIGATKEPEPGKTGANGSGKPPVKEGIKKFTKDQLTKMSPEEYEANRADILKAMEAGQIT
jgi:hypothetical protein